MSGGQRRLVAGRERRWIVPLAILLLTLGAFLVRLGRPPFDAYRFVDADSLYHLRLARLVDHDFPRPVVSDPYLDFPAGAAVPWPFLQEVAAAGMARLAGGGEERLMAVCFFLPAVLGAASLPLVYGVARDVGLGRGAAIAGAALSTLVPVHLVYSEAGRFDHHITDLVLALLFVRALTADWRRRGEPWRSRSSLVSGAAVALAACALPANWLGSTLHLFTGTCAVAATLVFGGRGDRTLPAWAARVGVLLGIGAMLLAGMFVAAYGPARLAEVVSDRPSGFQPLVLATLALALVFGGLLMTPAAGAGSRRRLRLSCAAASLLLSTSILAPEVIRGFDLYLRTDSRLMRSIMEFSSPFRAGGSLLAPRHAFGSGAGSLTWSYLLLLPALAAAWLGGASGCCRRGFPLLLVTACSSVALAAALAQYRYGIVLAPWLGVGAAVVFEVALRAGRVAGGRPSRAPVVLASFLLAAAFWPGFVAAARTWSSPQRLDAAPLVVEEAMSWLASHTPAASDDLDVRQPPAYGVLSFWDSGHTVIVLGHRPALATGFIGTLPGAERSLGFFTEEDPEAAYRFMRQNNLRYLVLEDFPNALSNALFIRGEDRRYRAYHAAGVAGLYREGHVPVALRLWDTAGAFIEEGGRVFEGSRHFRVVWDGTGPSAWEGAVRRVAIFEAVPGARLVGSAAPGLRVTALLPIDFRAQRGLPWAETAIADASGRWSMTVPYPTDRQSGESSPRGRYEVRVAGDDLPRLVAVPEEAVLGGWVIEVR